MQPRRELEAAALASRRAARSTLGPRRLGIDVVDRHRRDAAPVVDPGVEQRGEVLVGQVRRRLQMRPRRTEQEPRDGDRPEELLERGLGRSGHPRPGLRAEVLDDHLLHVSVALGSVADRDAARRAARLGVSPIPIRRPVVNGTRASPASRERLEPRGGQLVGRAEVRPAARATAGRRSSRASAPSRRSTRPQPRRRRPASARRG